jgi:hypothetical protein
MSYDGMAHYVADTFIKHRLNALLRPITGINLGRNVPVIGSGSLLVKETSFKRDQSWHEREISKVAKGSYLAPGQTWLDTHPASPKVSQIQ